MKKILLILVLVPVLCFSQARKYKKAISHKQLIAESRMNDLILHPSDYLLSPVNEINYIEFKRDTNYSNTREVYACITQRDGFDKNYSIGVIQSYLRSETEAAYIVTVFLKNGSQKSEYHVFDFSNGNTGKCEDYYQADYDASEGCFWTNWNWTRGEHL